MDSNVSHFEVVYATCHNYPGGGSICAEKLWPPPGSTAHLDVQFPQPRANVTTLDAPNRLWMPEMDFGLPKSILKSETTLFVKNKTRLQQLRHLSQSWDPGSWGRFGQNVHPPGRLSRKDESTPPGQIS